MTAVFSLHQYRLKPGISRDQLRRAFARAKSLGLLALPGLESAHLLWGLKGDGSEQPAVLWVYESQQSWENLWGPPEDPIGPERYPASWRHWEQELLAPLILGEPDQVGMTAYLTLDALFNQGRESDGE